MFTECTSSFIKTNISIIYYNQDLSSVTTSQLYLQSINIYLIDSGFQKEAIVVVDEKIYSNCMKVNFPIYYAILLV